MKKIILSLAVIFSLNLSAQTENSSVLKISTVEQINEDGSGLVREINTGELFSFTTRDGEFHFVNITKTRDGEFHFVNIVYTRDGEFHRVILTRDGEFNREIGKISIGDQIIFTEIAK